MNGRMLFDRPFFIAELKCLVLRLRAKLCTIAEAEALEAELWQLIDKAALGDESLINRYEFEKEYARHHPYRAADKPRNQRKKALQANLKGLQQKHSTVV